MTRPAQLARWYLRCVRAPIRPNVPHVRDDETVRLRWPVHRSAMRRHQLPVVCAFRSAAPINRYAKSPSAKSLSCPDTWSRTTASKGEARGSAPRGHPDRNAKAHRQGKGYLHSRAIGGNQRHIGAACRPYGRLPIATLGGGARWAAARGGREFGALRAPPAMGTPAAAK